VDSLVLRCADGIVLIKFDSLQVLELHLRLVEDKLLLLGDESVKDLLLLSDELTIVLAHKLNLLLCRFHVSLASRNVGVKECFEAFCIDFRDHLLILVEGLLEEALCC